ncbi:MAG: Flagellin protein FlaA, partial [uncultured Phycisphaerae bacterium]
GPHQYERLIADRPARAGQVAEGDEFHPSTAVDRLADQPRGRRPGRADRQRGAPERDLRDQPGDRQQPARQQRDQHGRGRARRGRGPAAERQEHGRPGGQHRRAVGRRDRGQPAAGRLGRPEHHPDREHDDVRRAEADQRQHGLRHQRGRSGRDDVARDHPGELRHPGEHPGQGRRGHQRQDGRAAVPRVGDRRPGRAGDRRERGRAGAAVHGRHEGVGHRVRGEHAERRDRGEGGPDQRRRPDQWDRVQERPVRVPAVRVGHGPERGVHHDRHARGGQDPDGRAGRVGHRQRGPDRRRRAGPEAEHVLARDEDDARRVVRHRADGVRRHRRRRAVPARAEGQLEPAGERRHPVGGRQQAGEPGRRVPERRDHRRPGQPGDRRVGQGEPDPGDGHPPGGGAPGALGRVREEHARHQHQLAERRARERDEQREFDPGRGLRGRDGRPDPQPDPHPGRHERAVDGQLDPAAGAVAAGL